MEFTKKHIDQVADKMNTTNVCISLDWLSFYFLHADFFNQGMSEGDTQIINDDFYLLCIDRPTLHFNKHVVVIYKKTECAHILFDTRNEKFFAKDICKVEFVNHTLYSGAWIDVYNILSENGLQYKAASRIDIAIDGVGYLKKLMNIYSKQSIDNKIIQLKNSGLKRGRFNPKVLNPKSCEYEGFHIGGGGGNKMITIYNKSLEIVKSGKTYIQDYWLKNGVIGQKEDLSELANQIEQIEATGIDVVSLNTHDDIYRFEIRLKSEAIKEIENFSPEMLMARGGIASIVKLHCKNYFELSYMDNSNVSRCTPIPLLPYDRLEAETIKRIARVEKDGEYKAKMTIHGIISDIYKGNVQRSNYNESVEMIMDRVVSYSLSDYLDRKLLEWDSKYKNSVEPERFNDVLIICSQIKSRNNELTDSIKSLAERHNQSINTAFFGD